MQDDGLIKPRKIAVGGDDETPLTVTARTTAPELVAPEPTEKPYAVPVVQNTAPTPSTDFRPEMTSMPTADDAIDSILQEESDALLEMSDEKALQPTAKPRKFAKLKNFFAAWWALKWARYTTIAVLLLGLAAVLVLPTTRYGLLNAVGVRSSASMVIVDQSTGLPMKNVTVTLGESEKKTDADGKVAFQLVRLGSQKLVISRVAFAPIEKTIVVGWGSNPLGKIALEATGAQYSFVVTDYLSGKPVTGVEALNSEASAVADKQGKVVLTVDDPKSTTLEISFTAPGYRTERKAIAVSQTESTDIKMVAQQPVVYVSKQSGKYDLYKIDADGQNKTLLLAGTGSERQNISVVTNPEGTWAALVSSRSNNRDGSGYLLDTLTLVDLDTKASKVVDEAQSIRLVDWVGPRLVYSSTYAAPSAAYTQRQRIVSYNQDQGTKANLVTADYFNGMISYDGYVYFALGEASGSQPAGFSRIKTDGTGKQLILNQPAWSITRASLTKINLETPGGWYDYTLGASTAQKGQSPSNPYSARAYILAPKDVKKYAWIDERDGKGVLIVTDIESNKDTTVASVNGLGIPLRWLNANTLTYRISSGSEVADYVQSINGGAAKKLTDVTNTSGFSYGYYF